MVIEAETQGNLAVSWGRIVQRLRAELGEDLFSSWFARMEPEAWDECRLTVSVPTRFLRNWIEAHYQKRLVQCVAAELGPVETIVVRVRTHAAVAPRKAIPAGTGDEAEVQGRPALHEIHASPVRDLVSDRGTPLDSTQTFETFIAGPSNALAHAAARRASEATEGMPVSFNPLFIHAASGLGKTHLLHSIAWQVRKTSPGRRVMMMSAERFMVNFVQALRARDTLSFKDSFAGVDVLLIDDFQFLQGKAMQQEFCHTFNSLVDSRRQIVVAADVPPARLDTIDQRMRSRLLGGLVVDITPPEPEMRRAMLERRLQTLAEAGQPLNIAPEVIEYVAERITGGGREIEGALNRIAAWHQFNGGAAVTLDLAATILRDMSQNPDLARVRIEDILKIIGRHFNVARADLLSARRARSVVMPRQIGMYLAKKLTPRSLPEIGRRFGGRDHSTVLHAVRKIEEQIKSDDRLAREVELLVRLVEQG